MKTVLRYGFLLITVYLVAWTASYMVIFLSRGGGVDFGYFFEYLVSAWTFRGGEVPTFIWLFSVIAFIPLAILATYLLKRYDRRKNEVA